MSELIPAGEGFHAREAETNPNQAFDNYAKEFQLRIELLRAAGEYAKNMAEARLTAAKAMHEEERVKTTALVNKSFQAALKRLERDQREYEGLQKRLAAEYMSLMYVLSGRRRPDFLTTFYDRLAAIRYFIEHSGDSQFMFFVVPAEFATPENFFSMSQTGKGIPPLPAGVTIGRLLVEMRRGLFYFEEGMPFHGWLAQHLRMLAEKKAAIVAELQAARDDARKGKFDKLTALLPFLKLEGG